MRRAASTTSNNKKGKRRSEREGDDEKERRRHRSASSKSKPRRGGGGNTHTTTRFRGRSTTSDDDNSRPMNRAKTSIFSRQQSRRSHGRMSSAVSSSSEDGRSGNIRSSGMSRNPSRNPFRRKQSRSSIGDNESGFETSDTLSTRSETSHGSSSGETNHTVPAPMLAKPELKVWNLLSELRRMPIARISRELQWASIYEETYGDLREFLEQWQVYFIISPFLDEVVLRSLEPASSAPNKGRPHGHHRFHYHGLGPGDCGSCAYMSVAESFDTKKLQAVYDRRGLMTEMLDGDVLIVTYAGVYDLFLFPNGCTVWWGANREDHWVVEDDFTKPFSACSSAWVNRHDLADIDELFPSWQIYQVDDKVGLEEGVNVEEGLRLFNEKLMFDYFRVPGDSERKVKLMISAALTMAAKADYFEHVADQISDNMEKLKYETIGLVEYLKGSLRLNKPWMLEGALREVRLRLRHATDPPLCVWDLQILQGYVGATTDQFNVESRINYVSAQCEAQSQALAEILQRWHRIFMIKSDFFIIVILVLDVFFLMFKMAYTMYFKKPEDE